MVRIEVTPAQVDAARIEVNAFRSAGLTPDPLVTRLAHARALRRGDDVVQPTPPAADSSVAAPAAPDDQALSGVRGTTVVDRGGDRIGTAGGAYVVDATGHPE